VKNVTAETGIDAVLGDISIKESGFGYVVNLYSD